jgi:23S rRNA (uridine2552-2'-O)-methyltransferase
MAEKKSSGRKGARDLHVRVKTAKGRRPSSTRWLQRQLNDPFVAAARRAGYRSRAAFKLQELDDKFQFLKPGARVVDLGAAPGGWSQIAVERVGDSGRVVAGDVTEMDPIPGVECFQLDVFEPNAIERLRDALGGGADVLLSDMAAPSTGHRSTDHLRIIGLCEAALDVAGELLVPGGTFVAKVLQGGTERELLMQLKSLFENVRHAKPDASRKDSAEMYVVALGFRGKKPEPADELE